MLAVLTMIAALATCPVTGWTLHLDPETNGRVRADLLRAGATNEKQQAAQREACRQSPAWWLTYFGWTYVVKETGEDGRERPPRVSHVPFIPWPVQIDALNRLHRCMTDGRDALLDKSRDMGASWLVVAAFEWAWQFRPDSQLLMVSRVEDLVDKPGDPDSLFWKVDYLIASQPSWLLPAPKADLARGGEHRSHMALVNPANGSSIMGQATTESIGIGGRKLAVLCDEAARIPKFAQVWRGLGDTTACRIANSTPFGGGTEFTRLRNAGLKDGTPTVIELSYRDHPQKGAGGEWRVDEKGELVDIPGLRYWWSPWFEARAARGDKLDLAQNVLCIHEQSGRTIFHAPAIYRLRSAAPDMQRCRLIWDRDGSSLTGRYEPDPRGPWWVHMAAMDAERRARTSYVMFCDPSLGVGAANGTIVVADEDRREQVAEYADPATPPLALAEQAAMASRTIWKGRHPMAAVGFEVNGPGGDFDGHLRSFGVQRIWRERIEGQAGSQVTRRYGWTSNNPKKRAAILALNRGLVRGDFRIVSARLLDECLAYVVCDDGSVDTPTNYDQETGARESHGDLVIGAVGVYLMLSDPLPDDGAVPGAARAGGQKYAPDTYGAWMGMNDDEGGDA